MSNVDDSKDDHKQSVTNLQVLTSTIDEISSQDAIYEYDDKVAAQLNHSKPWKKDPIYFKNCKINALAATKMVKHAIEGVNKGRKSGGLPIEIMGLLIGRQDINNRDTLIIMDCVELPVEGSETRVIADDEKVLGFMTRIQDRIEMLRKDRFIGWYHSHPFDINGNYSHCFLSWIDINTQLLWQCQFDKWIGIVIDPLRCLAKYKVDLKAFMCFPPFIEKPNKNGTWYKELNMDQKHWYQRGYYQLKHTFFMSSLVKHNLLMMNRKHSWIKNLSKNDIRDEEEKEKLNENMDHMVKRIDDGDVNKGVSICKDVAVAQCIDHTVQLVKHLTFDGQVQDD